jgi:hypothetical protein
MSIILIVIAVLIIWSIWGFASSRVEQTAYTVVQTEDDYEIRLYPAHIVAQTTVTGPYADALNQGFRIIAGYIFGGNSRKESIAMTAPVVEQKSSGESIAMTAPVVASIEGTSHIIAFGMPQSYTLATLPVPTDSRVKIVSVPEKRMAAIRFSWFRSDARIQSKKQELLAALTRDNISVLGEPQYAGYNGPWTPPWMIRNEILVEVK